MDKKSIALVGGIIIVIILMVEPMFWGGSGAQGTVTMDPGKNVSGTAVFNGTIRTYDPVLFIPTDTDPSLLSQLRLLPGVRDVKSDATGIQIQTDTRDDVFPTAAWLRARNVSSVSIANIAVNSEITVQTPGGEMNATVLGGVVRVIAEPLLDVDNEVSVSMNAVVLSKQVIDYSSASLLLQPIDMILDANVESMDSIVLSYAIPWVERNSLGNLSSYGDATYSQVDSIVFTAPLTVAQILAKKQFPYVTYIDSGSAQVLSSFDNTTTLAENFADTPYSLPSSRLVIRANRTPDIPFEPTLRSYQYTLRLVDPPYDMGSDTLPFETYVEYAQNATIRLNVSVLVLGDKVLSVKRVSLPS
jgi:hypothetical protein